MNTPIRIVSFKSNNYRPEDFKRKMSLHQHSSLEISYIISGEICLDFFSKQTNQIEQTHIFPGQFFIILPECPHSVNIPHSLTSLGLELICTNDDIVKYLKNSAYVNNLPFANNLLNRFNDILIFQDTQNVAYLLNQLKQHTELTSTDIFNENIYELSLKRLLIEILKCTNESLKIPNKNIYIRKATSYIESNYMYQISAQSIAAYLGISEIYLQKMFRQSLKTSVNTFINKIRINKAIALISATNFPLEKISRTVGYKSVQSFIFNFKKCVGIVPSEYKKTSIHNDNFEFFLHSQYYREKKLIDFPATLKP